MESGSQPPKPDKTWLESKSAAMARVLALTREVAATDTSVLLMGETGTGKEVLARHLHASSRRAAKTFLAVNCGALPLHLAESELFGHEKGAFSGASDRRQGYFETADGGTLVLDEVSELALPLQTRLLRVLQEREVQRVGASKVIPIDVRVVATTNRDLRAMVAAGEFRKDLFYRINVFPLTVPPLRERLVDVADLATAILWRLTSAPGAAARARAATLTAEAQVKLVRYDWPGNVRELANVLERALVLAKDGVIGPESIVFDDEHSLGGEVVSLAAHSGFSSAVASHGAHGPHGPPGPIGPSTGSSLRPRSLHEQERQSILEALAHCGGNRTHAARRLGISVRTLRNRLRDYRDEGVPVTPPVPGAPPRVGASIMRLPVRIEGGTR